MIYSRKANISFFTMKARSIKFTIKKGSRAPKEINKEKTIFAVFAPEKLTICPGQTIFIHTKFAVTYPDDILTTFLIMPTLQKEGLKIIGQNNEANQRVRLEYFNPTLKTFTIKKHMKIAIFMTLNEGNESFKKEIVKIKTS